MLKFLVNTRDDGFVTAVQWCEPPGLLHAGVFLHELFVNESRNSILQMIKNAGEKGTDSSAFSGIVLGEKIVPVTFFSLMVQDQLIVLGFDSGATSFEICREYIETYNDYVNKVRQEFSKAIKDREESIREQFEEIQQLNNELINTRRMLEKANIILDHRNRDLQGKLARDELTGLIGRHQYWEAVEGKIQKDPGKIGVFTYIDIDDFKFINDTYGHAAGDVFLVEFARRLQSLPLPGTSFIRIAGDEFAFFTYGKEAFDPAYLDTIWEKVRSHVLAEPINAFDFSLPVSISAGMAVYGLDTKKISELVEYADFAMYQAKSRGKNRYARFDKADYLAHKLTGVRLEALREVVADHEIYHVYQPIVSASTGSVYAYALQMRTECDSFKDTQDLLQLALEKGKYTELNRVSLEVLMETLPRFENALQGKRLFITQGPYPLYRGMIVEVMHNSRFFHHLVVETVESRKTRLETLVKNTGHARENGYRLAVKNFGTGEANDLMVLAAAPHYIKIHMELVRHIQREPGRQQMLQRVIQFAHALSIDVIAEGIENREEMETMIRLQADYLQGYYLGEPQAEPGSLQPRIREEIIASAGHNHP